MGAPDIVYKICPYVLDVVNWPVIVLDVNRQITSANSASRRMFPKWADREPSSERKGIPGLSDEIKRVMTSCKKVSVPKKMSTAEGPTIFQVELIRMEHPETSEIAGVVVSFRDLACGRNGGVTGGCQFRELIGRSHNSYFVVNLQTGLLLDTNSVSSRVLGYTKKELYTKCFWDIETEASSERLRKIFLRAIRSRGNWEVDGRYRRKDGTTFPVRLHIFHMMQGENEYMIVLAYDITPYKEMEEKLQQQILFLQYVIDVLPYPVFFKGTDFRYLGCNTAFEKLIGISRSQLIGKNVNDILPGDLADTFNRTDAILFKKKQVQIYKSEFLDCHGNCRDAIFQRTPFFNSDGTLGGLIGIVIDLQDFRQLDKELKTIQSVLE